MAVSKRTIDEIKTELISWMVDYNLPMVAIKSLFRRLIHVRGNQSFMNTISRLHAEFEREK